MFELSHNPTIGEMQEAVQNDCKNESDYNNAIEQLSRYKDEIQGLIDTCFEELNKE